MDHFGKRYVPAQAFRDEVRRLRIIRGHVADSDLEKLEQERLVVPRLRIRYPDAIARRWWLEAHPQVGEMIADVEPDGPRFDAANDLEKALHRRRNQHAYGPQLHPLDEIDSRFAEFVHQPSERAFVPWSDLRIDVSNNTQNTLRQQLHPDAVQFLAGAAGRRNGRNGYTCSRQSRRRRTL